MLARRTLRIALASLVACAVTPAPLLPRRRRSPCYRGRDVAVRDADGIHLNVAGTAIAAKVIADELRHR